MRRQVQVGHQLLPVCNLGWSAEQWRTAADAMEQALVRTTQLIQGGAEQIGLALRLQASIEHKLAEQLRQVAPAELSCDLCRHLFWALKRSGHLEQAGELEAMFNTVPGYLA